MPKPGKGATVLLALVSVRVNNRQQDVRNKQHDHHACVPGKGKLRSGEIGTRGRPSRGFWVGEDARPSPSKRTPSVCVTPGIVAASSRWVTLLGSREK